MAAKGFVSNFARISEARARRAAVQLAGSCGLPTAGGELAALAAARLATSPPRSLR
jgi:hypothetical protein